MRTVYILAVVVAAFMIIAPVWAMDTADEVESAEDRIHSLLEAASQADNEVSSAVDILSNKEMEIHEMEDRNEINNIESETDALIQYAESEAVDPITALQLSPYDTLALLETSSNSATETETETESSTETETESQSEGESEVESESESGSSANVIEDGAINAYPINENEESSFIELEQSPSASSSQKSNRGVIQAGKRKIVHLHVEAPGRKLGVKASHLGKALHKMTSMHSEVVDELSNVLNKLKFLKRTKPCNKIGRHGHENDDTRAWRREVTHVSTIFTEKTPSKEEGADEFKKE